MLQQKTGSPVQLELTKGTRATVAAWIKMLQLRNSDYLFQSRVGSSRHISTRQYNRIFHEWIRKLGLDETLYSMHSMRRTKPYLIYKNEESSGNPVTFASQKLESTVRYLGIEVDDARRYQGQLKSSL